jgi:hypothetical protein
MIVLRHSRPLLTFAITGVLSLGFSVAVAEVWDAKGDYARTDQSPVYRGWKVVDPDSAGLNCRMANQYRSVRLESQKIGSPALIPDKKHAIGNWPVLVQVPRNTVLTASLIDWRGGKVQVSVMDVNNRPWLALKTYRGECLVRANSRYIQPIPASGQPLPKG